MLLRDLPIHPQSSTALLICWFRVFGDAGRHVRAAVGVSALPRNALVELQMTVRITEGPPNHDRTHPLLLPTHSVWDRSIPPRLHIQSGDEVAFECVDASGGQVRPGMTVEEYLAIDRTRIHALTGPVWIEGAEPGDVLEIDVLSTRHADWGWSSVIEGLGFLKDRFREPYLFHWQLEGESTASLAPAVVPLRPFLGVMGVARAEDGKFRTRPPGPSAAISTCANCAPAPAFTCPSTIPARFSVAETATPPRVMAKSASTASSARSTSPCASTSTSTNRLPVRSSSPARPPHPTLQPTPGWL
jgi:hypothetical protein